MRLKTTVGNPLAGRSRSRARRKDAPWQRKGIGKNGVKVDDANFQLAAARASGLGAPPEFQGTRLTPFSTVSFQD